MIRIVSAVVSAAALVTTLALGSVSASASSVSSEDDTSRNSWSSPATQHPAEGATDDPVQALCTYWNAGDYPHITAGDISVHGWWDAGDCKSTQKADVEVKLQVFNGLWWEDVAKGSKAVYPGGGAGKRANARYTWKNTTTEREVRSWVRAVPQDQINLAVPAESSGVKLKCG